MVKQNTLEGGAKGLAYDRTDGFEETKEEEGRRSRRNVPKMLKQRMASGSQCIEWQVCGVEETNRRRNQANKCIRCVL